MTTNVEPRSYLEAQTAYLACRDDKEKRLRLFDVMLEWAAKEPGYRAPRHLIHRYEPKR